MIDTSKPSRTSVDKEAHVHVLLFSGLAGVQGHGRRYLEELSTRLASARDLSVAAATPAVGGLTDVLERHGVECHTIPLDFSQLNAENFRSYGPLAGAMRGLTRLRFGHLANRHVMSYIRKAANDHDVTIVHFLDYEYLTLVEALRRLEHTPGVDAVVTVHPSDFRQREVTIAALYKHFVRYVLGPRLRHAGATICHGNWIADRIRKQFNLDEGVVPIYYPSEGEDRRVDKDLARTQLGCPRDKRVLLWFGMIRKNKRLDVALNVLAALPDDYVLLIVGKPSEVGGDEVHRLIEESDVRERVITRLEYVPESEIPLYFSAADALIATHDSSFSSASGPVGDARTYRLPVVASDAGQIAEYVSRFGVGRTASIDRPDLFADTIRRVLEDPETLRAFQDRIEEAAHELSWQAFAERHREVYVRIARERRH